MGISSDFGICSDRVCFYADQTEPNQYGGIFEIKRMIGNEVKQDG